MLIKRPKDFELNLLFDKLVMIIKDGDRVMLEYEFDYDKKIKGIKGSSNEATTARNTLGLKKFNLIRERRISTLQSIINTTSEKLKELESRH